MSANFPPGTPSGHDPDQTTRYRTPQGQQPADPYAQPYPHGNQNPHQGAHPPGPPYGTQPQQGAPYGSQPPQGRHYGAQPAPGQPYGSQPPPPNSPYQQTQAQPYPYQQPQQTQQASTWQGGEMLGTAPAHHEEPRKKKGGWLIAVVAALVVALVGGGGFFAFTMLSGGGTQPHEVLPGNAMAYVRLDLDPAANQKLALFEIARKFSATKDAFAGDDLRKSLFDGVLKDLGAGSDLTYARDIEPWLGSRVGVALLPGARGEASPDLAFAIQVTDEAQAREGVKKLMGDDEYGIAFREDYIIITESPAAGNHHAAAPTLAENAEFTGDLAALGEPGVLSAWFAPGKLIGVAGTAADQAFNAEQLKNARVVAALRFDGQYAELAGLVRGAEGIDVGELSPVPLGKLPVSTAAAVSISGAGKSLEKQWDQVIKSLGSASDGQALQQFITSAQQQYGLAIPGDLVTLLGDNLTVSLDGTGLSTQQFTAGLRIGTGDPAKVKDVVGKIERALSGSGQPVPQLAKADGDGSVAVATSQQYAQQLAQGGGTLGENETYQLAVADGDAANYAAFVDLDKIEKFYLEGMSGDERANLQVLRAVGLSGKQAGNDASFSLRLLFN
ncbi:Protein of unknown function [Sinosporangium album]|uniref:DUF3352 domain-containing protein n=1 Tax=Sinosporangium album TaxID=504805 RepID=A0A1G7V7C6_9ACTN|nr:DUF3352 domain-containing protein [Sinosporangium album]SDG55488.1 Protein of unknown function [Sinosporangium album]